MSLTIKNYKKLEGWAHFGKEFMIGEVGETADSYIFRVGYNGIPYTIKIFRELIGGDYEIVLRDGSDITQYGRTYISKENMKTIDEITTAFEWVIRQFKPMAKGTNNPFYSNGPF